ncbi:MAG: flagellar motor protein MotB [Pseudomonadota bacterium]|mgnify:FL=1|jgi:chemotaxis protein MotB|uniref:Chemotaxis protein MotB n=1 Tax=Qipengyuania flava TaxID=192812 RepID=A0A3T1CKZ0_9SPHN|nr:flagellar motor protein MotB [Qipengyuania flava]KZX51584.1 flagellar motor protein [Erythrobacter sp. HI00D59]KZX89025.1 flagellar motor protein [Erythrobacter sp. HI0020]KZY19784.1 flagellar motor protein [Erythrobacter sp. HI0038]KZY22889.1 flagellar motor protein [Erythrobacter sp. HI0037]MCS5600769.1 OmpA family protein [Paracoccus sp. (in: a-proteobacteria)]MEC7162534.1 flagellar motor protein MotB [Pseudomonadota bacterium]OAN82618.1 flagellar motor protein [Erythrobacter sp. EhN03|tara:strand:- start:1073 stop:1903 length:831 start_codon:yes stop_codon:yes gene_type:complete
MASSAAGRNDPAPIIVKKVTVVEAGHHGGAWKVAYADFVTAMMAFFLLLWLLGATTEDQRKGLADYFTPTLVKTKEQSAGADGVLGGSSLVDVDNYPHAAGQTGTQTLTVPRDATGGPKEGAASIRRIQQRVDDAIADKKRLERLMRQVRMIDTTTGIRIDLVDDADFSMFSLGTTVLTTDARELLDLIAQAIGPEGGKITVRGHTDALKYRDPSRVNNWSLSAGRAETTRQNLIRHGIVRERFRRIEGVADTEPLIADDPSDPRNRRISITLERS